MAKNGPVTSWNGNNYYGHGENVPYVYVGSSSAGHVVTPNPANNKSSGGSGSSVKKKSTVKKSAATTVADTTNTAKVSGYRGGGGSGGSSDSGYDAAAAREEYLKKLQKLAKKVYNANMNAIKTSYTGAGDTLQNNYNSTTDELADKYSYQQKLVNSDAENSMRQAYINSMLQKKDLAQRMSAQGLTGGATETTMAGLNNNYSNARNNIDTTRQRSLSDLNQTYQSNLGDVMRQYNSAVSDLAMQRAQAEQAARNAYLQMAVNYMFDPGNISIPTTDYSSSISKQNSYSYTPTEAKNTVSGVATTQSSPDIINSAQNNYAMYLAQQRAAGANNDSLKNEAYSALQNGKISGDELVNILNQLGVQV